MIDHRQCRLSCLDRRDDGCRCAHDHHHLDTEQAGGLDFRIGSGATTVLGNDDVDVVLLQQFAFALQRERTPIEDVFDIRKRKRRFDGIDAADEIVMLQRRFRMMRALSADRQKDMAGGGAERFDGSRNALHLLPAIAGHALPFGTAQSDRSDTGGLGGKGGIGRNSLGEGMRGVDQQSIAAGFQEIGQRRSTAETPNANRNRLCGRYFSASSERQQNIAITPRRKRLGQQARLAGAAEDQDARSYHV